VGGTRRMRRESHVRCCEGLGVRFPGPTRRRRHYGLHLHVSGAWVKESMRYHFNVAGNRWANANFVSPFYPSCTSRSGAPRHNASTQLVKDVVVAQTRSQCAVRIGRNGSRSVSEDLLVKRFGKVVKQSRRVCRGEILGVPC
jgi:hypothetical protein